MRKRLAIFLLVSTTIGIGWAQNSGDSDRAQRIRQLLLERFDKDGDGRLSDSERQAMREALQARAGARATRATQKSSLSGLYGQVDPAIPLVQKNLEIYDPARQKQLTYRVTYPKGAGKFPVIMWSHGMYGSQDNYGPLVEHWARHGYMVVQPSHSDSITRGKGNFSAGFYGNSKDWASRPKDISFLLDSLPRDKELAQHADFTRVGMGGHSFGAHTTMLVNGAMPTVGGSLSDPRPRAFLAISPQGESPLFSKQSWQGLKRPTLFISGDNDSSPTGEKPEWRLDPYRGCPPGEKYLLWVKGAHHNFGGISGLVRQATGPENPDQVEVVKAASLAFWDAYLKGDSAARKVIAEGKLGAQAQPLYTWQER